MVYRVKHDQSHLAGTVNQRLMPLKGKGELFVAVPSTHIFFGGGIDNPVPEAQTSGGAIRGSAGRRRARQSARRETARREPFAGVNKPVAPEPNPGHIPAYDRYKSQFRLECAEGNESKELPAGPPTTGLSGSLGAMEIAADAPISTRTRLRKKLGFPLPPTGALAALERDAGDTVSERRMVSMSVAAAKQRGAADAAAAAAKAKEASARQTRASISQWLNLPDPARGTAGPGDAARAWVEPRGGSGGHKGRLAMLPSGPRRQRVAY